MWFRTGGYLGGGGGGKGKAAARQPTEWRSPSQQKGTLRCARIGRGRSVLRASAGTPHSTGCTVRRAYLSRRRHLLSLFFALTVSFLLVCAAANRKARPPGARPFLSLGAE